MKEKAIKRSYVKTQTGDRIFAFALLLPAIITTAAFILIPVADSIYRSFFDYKVKNIISGKPGVWNDFANYIKLFSNGKLVPSMTNTLMFVLGVVTAQFVLGMALALILNTNIRFSRFIRSIMMVPWVVPTLISGLVWLWLFQPQYGLVKYFAGFLTGGRVTNLAVLNNPSTAMLGVSLAALWKQIPLAALLLLAGLANVPEEILEAAKIDGANGVQRFFNIVLPYMKSVIKVTVSMSIIENFKQFPLFWTMTGGGPNNSTTTMAILSYREAFVSNNFGSGAAVTTVWMLLMIVVVFIYNRIFRTDDM